MFWCNIVLELNSINIYGINAYNLLRKGKAIQDKLYTRQLNYQKTCFSVQIAEKSYQFRL